MFHGTRDFKRSIQLDDYSCGSRSAYMILRHFGHRMPHAWVKYVLGTNEKSGTNKKPLRALFRRKGLSARIQRDMGFKDLRKALGRGAVVLVDVDGDHYAVVHGVGDKYVHIADPSFIRCPKRRLSHKRFRKRWQGWGLVVAPPAKD